MGCGEGVWQVPGVGGVAGRVARGCGRVCGEGGWHALGDVVLGVELERGTPPEEQILRTAAACGDGPARCAGPCGARYGTAPLGLLLPLPLHGLE